MTDDIDDSSLQGEVTQILEAWRLGQGETLERLLPIVYGELKRLAAAHLRRERSDHTLQPTALVHEAYMRLLRSDGGRVENRSHFFAVAAQAMRRILVEHARQHQAQKRLSPADKIPIDDSPVPVITPNVDIIELHDALDRLAELNPRYVRVVEMRYFGGLTHDEIAIALDVSVSTVERDWQVARLWLKSTVGSAPS